MIEDVPDAPDILVHPQDRFARDVAALLEVPIVVLFVPLRLRHDARCDVVELGIGDHQLRTDLDGSNGSTHRPAMVPELTATYAACHRRCAVLRGTTRGDQLDSNSPRLVVRSAIRGGAVTSTPSASLHLRRETAAFSKF
jgi:hypothetical protein